MINFRKAIKTTLAIFFFLDSFTAAFAQDPVKMHEGDLTLTTYLVGKPNPDPLFYNVRAYQGAKGQIYPYAMIDNLTDKKVEKKWHAIYLENEYVEICILPEIGGKLWYARDKTDNYNFIYYNKQVKPALIGMLGAWTSGGLEWNVPHHHRASTFMPVDYTLENNADGSKTIWIGETERRQRTKWMVGYTIYPGKAYVETTIKLYNRTPLTQSFLIFANTAVHVDSNYQVFFPPETQYGTFHSKNQFTEWPISHQVFGGTDYRKGVDVSMWKNHPHPVSIFDWGNGDFVAGYHHEEEAGTLIMGNPHEVTGRKFFEWGPGPEGNMWNRILTDSSGHYLELMTGAYSDNQPDYSWNNPYMVKTATMIFAPLRKIGGVKKANREVALNLDINSDKARIAINTTAAYTGAQVVLTAGSKNIFSQKITISPASPYVETVSLPAGVDQYDLKLSVLSPDGKPLISYSPVKQEKKTMSEPVRPPQAPKDIKTVEQLYRIGLRLEQFYNPTIEPLGYYEEALRRDAGNSLVNTQMGIYYLKRGNYAVAEKHLRTAVATVTTNYTAPKNGEPLYYLGVSLLMQGHFTEAYNWLYKASWDYAWYSPAFYLLTTIDVRNGDFEEALKHIDQSLETNMLNTNAFALKAEILRALNRPGEAREAVEIILKKDPLSFWGMNERYLLEKPAGSSQNSKTLTHLTHLMRDEVENYLELATDYGNAGLYNEAIDVLSRAVNSNSDKLNTYPMVYYFLGYYWDQLGNKEKAVKNYQLAGKMPTDYCFPYRFEAANALYASLKYFPDDARAFYYLGNLYYDNIPEKAVAAWEKSVKLDNSFAMAHRNLAFAYSHFRHDNSMAIAEMEKAIKENSNDPQYYAELDKYYESGKVAPEKRLNLLTANAEVVAQSEAALTSQLYLLIFKARYDEAIKILKNHHFRQIEGVGNIHQQWVDAYLLRGNQFLAQNKYELALDDFNQALKYPENLEVGEDNREGQICYFIGKTYQAMGQTSQAGNYFNKVIKADYRQGSEQGYYQALAYRELRQTSRANEVFQGMVSSGQKQLSDNKNDDFFEKFSEAGFSDTRTANLHYVVGLGLIGMDKKSKAKEEFEEAIKLNPAHLGAKVQLEAL